MLTEHLLYTKNYAKLPNLTLKIIPLGTIIIAKLQMRVLRVKT